MKPLYLEGRLFLCRLERPEERFVQARGGEKDHAVASQRFAEADLFEHSFRSVLVVGSADADARADETTVRAETHGLSGVFFKKNR